MAGTILLVSIINFLFVLVGYFMARTLQCDTEREEGFVSKIRKPKFDDEDVFVPED